MKDRRNTWLWTLAFLGLGLGMAAEPKAAENGAETVPLWEGGAPGTLGTEAVDVPSLTVYLPPAGKATGAGVVICPGGGYGFLAMDHEGHQVAQWLNSIGVAGFIVQYRIAPKYHHPCPMLDAQRAVRLVRARAEKWGVEPNKIGILGFSAGGHLASTVATHFDAGKPDAADEIDRQSCRPDFAVLVYPVISFTTEYTHTGSRKNLLGEDPDPELVKLFSNELQVSKETPPTFLIHTYEDTGVPAENSILFYEAMRKAGVPGELHIYQKGPHGFGLAPNDPILSHWPKVCEDWFQTLGLIQP